MNRPIQLGILLILLVSATNATPPQKATRVLVLKKEHKMQLFSGETVIKTYSVALGRGGLAPKQRQGDHLTPEGLYQIDRRNKNSGFYRALHVSYPNEADRESARKLGVDPGGDIKSELSEEFGDTWVSTTTESEPSYKAPGQSSGQNSSSQNYSHCF
jgi:hypothetical protein